MTRRAPGGQLLARPCCSRAGVCAVVARAQVARSRLVASWTPANGLPVAPIAVIVRVPVVTGASGAWVVPFARLGSAAGWAVPWARARWVTRTAS